MVSYEVGLILVRMRFIDAIRKLKQHWRTLQPPVQLTIPYMPLNEDQFQNVMVIVRRMVKKASEDNAHVLKDQVTCNLFIKLDNAYQSWVNKYEVYIHEGVTKPFFHGCDTEEQFFLRWYGLILAAEHNIRAISNYYANKVIPKMMVSQLSMSNINSWRLKLLESLSPVYQDTVDMLPETVYVPKNNINIDIKTIFHWSFVILQNDFMSLSLCLCTSVQSNKKLKN